MHQRSKQSSPERRIASAKRRQNLSQRGVVMIITLLALILLAALVMYVLNLGSQVNRRIVTQHSADSSIVAGSGWVARSFNTVAMNNVGISRLIASVSVLDAMPQGVAYTLEDQRMIEEALRLQLARGVGVDRWWVRNPPTEGDPLQNCLAEVQREIATLDPVNQTLNDGSYDISELTYYAPPGGGTGRLWAAMQTMDQLSQATMENLGVLAQLSAVEGGLVNFPDRADDKAAIMLPVIPNIPWQRGSFADFERPVRNGLLPTAADDTTENRGPFDTIFGWRTGVGGTTDGYYSGPDQIAGGGRGNTPLSSGARSVGNFVVTGRDPDAYRVYGPHTWLLRRVGGYADSNLRFSRFGSRVSNLANIKLDYLYPQPDTPSGERNVTDPDWVIGYPSSLSIATSDPAPIRETAFAIVEIRSRYPRTHPNFMNDGSWDYVARRREPVPRIAYTRGWQDPATWNVDQVANHVWEDQWTYEVFFDESIGVSAQSDTDGNRIPQTIYRIDTFVFLGVNVGTDAPVRNPHNFSGTNDLPGPIDFDHNVITSDDFSRQQNLTFLSVARQSNRSILWPSRFDAGRSDEYMVGLAQARVFNDHSWDLWTQMWRSQLVPVGPDYAQWLDRMDAGRADLTETPFIDANAYDQLHDYLTGNESLAEIMLSH